MKLTEQQRCVHCRHYATRVYSRADGTDVLICVSEQCLRDEHSLDAEYFGIPKNEVLS